VAKWEAETSDVDEGEEEFGLANKISVSGMAASITISRLNVYRQKLALFFRVFIVPLWMSEDKKKRSVSVKSDLSKRIWTIQPQ